MRPRRNKFLDQKRTRKDLSQTVKDFGGYKAASHLGNKPYHDTDAAKQREWMRSRRAKKLGIKPEELDDELVVDQALVEAGGSGGRVDDKNTGKELKAEGEIRDLLGQSGLVLAMAFVGTPGDRGWQDLEGDDWVLAMMAEKRDRRNYRTTQKVVEGGPKPLQVMLARLRPWTALELGERLLGDPEELRRRIKRLIAAFQKRYNVDVVGVVAHRESTHDLHLHLVFSQTREVLVEKPATAREKGARKKQLVAEVREEMKSEGKPATNKAVSAEIARQVEAGEMPDPNAPKRFVENRRFRETGESIQRNVMGHSFRSKLQIWRAAAEVDKDAVAALHDKAASDPYSFRGRLVAEEVAGKNLEEFWWDLWTAEEWDRVCREDFEPELLRAVDDRGCIMAQDFVRYGSTLPSLAERLAVDRKKADLRAAELEGRVTELEEVVEVAESTMKSLHESVPPELLRETVGRTVEGLVSEVVTLRESAQVEAGRVVKLQGQVEELKAVVEEAESTLKSVYDAVPGDMRWGTVEETVSHLVAEVATSRQRDPEVPSIAEDEVAGNVSVPSDIEEVSRVLIERMETHPRKKEWDVPEGSIVTRVSAFLDWLDAEPKRLMEKFQKLVLPIYSEIKNWPPAKDLINFLGWGRGK